MESISGDSTTFNFDYTQFFNPSIRADPGKYYFWKTGGKCERVTCLPTSVGILLLERRIREKASKQLNVTTHRARKRKIGGNLGSILFFSFAQLFPCIMICSFEEKYSPQKAVTRSWHTSTQEFIYFQFYMNRISFKETVPVYTQGIFPHTNNTAYPSPEWPFISNRLARLFQGYSSDLNGAEVMRPPSLPLSLGYCQSLQSMPSGL